MRLDLTPAQLSMFLTKLLEQLRSHLEDADDEDRKRATINEARQYLRGAHAICASAAIGTWSQQDEYNSADGLSALLNHMIEEAHATIDEIEDESLSLIRWPDQVAARMHNYTEH